jgi:NAD(P)-dependent dehydrogenase (short-subunit alcohol dehydrogenase family)
MTAGIVALVTGAGSGIGQAVAELWAERGAHVYVADIDEAGATATVEAIRLAGGSADFQQVNVADADQVGRLFERIARERGQLHWACNNAGIVGDRSEMAQYDPDEFDRVMAINVRGVFLCMRHELPMMLARNSGSIINICSQTALKAGIANCAYTASKHAVHGLTKSAAFEVARTGVRVNAVGPGNIRTAIVDRAPPELRARAEQMPPSKRFGEPREVAEAVAWLASDAASLVNGHLLMADDGWAIC